MRIYTHSINQNLNLHKFWIDICVSIAKECKTHVYFSNPGLNQFFHKTVVGMYNKWWKMIEKGVRYRGATANEWDMSDTGKELSPLICVLRVYLSSEVSREKGNRKQH